MKVLLLIAAVLPYISCQPGSQQPYLTDINNPFVIFAVNGINHLYASRGDNRERVATQVIHATSQIVAGAMYRFQIEVSGEDGEEVCSVSVWSRPWLGGDEATQLQGSPVCVTKKSSRRQVGQPVTVDLSDIGALKALIALESNITATLKSPVLIVGIQFGGITKQVVSGIIYMFTNVRFAKSSCAVEIADSNYNACANSAIGAKVLTVCTSELYWYPRRTPEYTITTNICHDQSNDTQNTLDRGKKKRSHFKTI